MHSINKIRNSIITKLQHLSPDKLKQVDNLLNEIENKPTAKEITLQFAGSWKDLDEEVFNDFTTNLHVNRVNDRQFF